MNKQQGDKQYVSPEFIIDAVEKAIEKGEWVVRPGSAKPWFAFVVFSQLYYGKNNGKSKWGFLNN